MSVKEKQPIRTKQPIRVLGPAHPSYDPKKAIAVVPVKAKARLPERVLSDKEVPEVLVPQEESHLIDIPIEEILITPDPHRVESEDQEKNSIFDLARSFQDLGMLQPVVVKALAEGGYEIIAGRKRVKAASLLKWETVPAIVKNYDDAKTKMAVITENIIRTGYSKVEFDKAIAEWGNLYEALHPETKKNAAGGNAAAAKKIAASGKKAVSSKPVAKTFTRTVAEATGVKPRTVEKARKRGTTFTDDDYAVFKQKNIKVHDQDSIASVTDPRKRMAIIKSIHEGVPFQKAFDFVMLPPGSTVSRIDANDEANGGKPQTDEEWLSQCPVRSKVVTKTFDAHALFYRRILDFKSKLERGFNAARKEFKGLTGGSKGYPAAVNRFLKVKHPKEWVVCGTCAGSGHKDKLPCTDCDEGGFKIN